MANVITQFLVGIGLDTSDFEKGEKRVKTSMEGVKSSTLAIGSAMASAAIGAGVRVDQLAEKSRKLQDQLYRTNTQTTWAQGYGSALKELGGNADDAVGRIAGLEEKLAAIRMGDRSFLDALGPAGFNSGQLAQAKSAQEFITMAADQFARASHTQQVNMANVLGLTDQEFKLWQHGGSYVESHSQQLATQLGYTEKLNQQQYEYSQEWVKLNLEMDKAGNTLSFVMLPSMTKLVGLANEYAGAFNSFAQQNPDTVSAGVTGGGIAATGFGVASIGALAGKLGIPGAGMLRAAGPLGAAAGVAVASEPWVDKGLNALFGSSEYYQNLRTAPTWGEFGQALVGQRETTPEVSQYVEMRNKESEDTSRTVQSNLPSWNAYQTGKVPSMYTTGSEYAPNAYSRDYNADATGAATATSIPPINVKPRITVAGKVEMDGRAMGEFVATQIDEHNEQAAMQFSTRTDR